MIYDGSKKDLTNFLSDNSIDINSCGIQKSKQQDYTVIRERGRVDYHILFVAGGECLCLYEGVEHRLLRGDFVLYPPQVPQRYSFMDKTAETLWVHFTGTEVASLLSSLSLTGGVYHTDAPHQAEQDFAHMVRAHALHTAGGRVGAVGYLLTLLAHLSSATLPQEAQGNHGAVSDMAEFISRNWQKNISTAHVAAAVHLSESRAAHLFRMGMGISLHRYLEGIRIQNAKELLLDTDMTVSQISAMVGYADPLYFSRVFRKSVGVSPAAYRKEGAGSPSGSHTVPTGK